MLSHSDSLAKIEGICLQNGGQLGLFPIQSLCISLIILLYYRLQTLRLFCIGGVATRYAARKMVSKSSGVAFTAATLPTATFLGMVPVLLSVQALLHSRRPSSQLWRSN